MEIVSGRDFRSQMGVYLERVKEGVDVVLQVRGFGAFKLVPITEDDTLQSKEEFFAEIRESLARVERGEGKTFDSADDLVAYLEERYV